jgi:hypothetical protein
MPHQWVYHVVYDGLLLCEFQQDLVLDKSWKDFCRMNLLTLLVTGVKIYNLALSNSSVLLKNLASLSIH